MEFKERRVTGGGLFDIYSNPYNDNHFILRSSLFRETVFPVHTLDSKRGMERTGRG